MCMKKLSQETLSKLTDLLNHIENDSKAFGNLYEIQIIGLTQDEFNACHPLQIN